MSDIPRGKQNAAEHRFWVHGAFLPTQDGSGAMAAILTLFMCPMALGIVVMYPLSVDVGHLFPRACLHEFRVYHFSDDIEVCFYIVLPCLPFLDTLFSDPQSHIHIHCLITVKLSTSVTDNHRWSTKGREGFKEHFQKIPLRLRGRNFARQASSGVVLQHTDQVHRLRET